MTLIAQPPASTTDEEIQVLFKEARRRRRRRWAVVAAILCVIAVVLAMLVGTDDTRTSRHPARPHVGLPRWIPPLGSARTEPLVYVAGDGNGGIGVYSTATGTLASTISPQGVGGPDEQAVLSGDRKSLFFAQPKGACSGDILGGPVSGARAPTVAISVPETLALETSPSPTSNDLAWVGVTCGSLGTTSTLYVTNLATGVQRTLGPFTGKVDDVGISWSTDGQRLAVESGETVEVMASAASPSKVLQMDAPPGCTLTNPAFLSNPNQLAAIRTCYHPAGSLAASRALVYNVKTGKPMSLIVAAPPGSTLQSLSVDSARRHILVGVVGPYGAQTAQVEGGQLVTVSKTSLTAAQW